MGLIKIIHVLAVFIWIGNLLALNRMMIAHLKQDPEIQQKLLPIYRHMANFVGLPAMVIALCSGFLLLSKLNLTYHPGWFHMKMTFMAGLVIANVFLMVQLSRLEGGAVPSRSLGFQLLHGSVALLLVGLLCSTYLVRDRKGEWLAELQKEGRALWHQEAILGKNSDG